MLTVRNAESRSVDELCEEQPDVLLVCSSILSTEAVVRAIPFGKLRPDTIVADVLSVKLFPRNLLLEVHPQKSWSHFSAPTAELTSYY
jgi:prephenate dehydrogenase